MKTPSPIEVENARMAERPILLTDALAPPPALIRAGLEALPAIIRAQGECTSRRFIEFFTAQHPQPQHAHGICAGKATGITTYLQNGGTLEHAQTVANHESPRTTKLCDRAREELSFEEVERIKI